MLCRTCASGSSARGGQGCLGEQPHCWHARSPTGLLVPNRLKQTPFCAPATYPLGVSSPADWHGPEDWELQERGGRTSVTVPGRRGGGECRAVGLRLHPRTSGQAQQRDGGRRPTGTLTLTDFAIDGHLQPQAQVFLVVDGFGCKINPQGVKEPLLEENRSTNALVPAHFNPPSGKLWCLPSLGSAHFLPHVQPNLPSLE